jgi:hypothetical protein
MPNLIYFKEGKTNFDSSFQRIQSMASWPHALEMNSMEAEMWRRRLFIC